MLHVVICKPAQTALSQLQGCHLPMLGKTPVLPDQGCLSVHACSDAMLLHVLACQAQATVSRHNMGLHFCFGSAVGVLHGSMHLAAANHQSIIQVASQV